MTARNPLLSAPPFEIEDGLKRLGADLRTARLRRNLSLEALAGKIGVSRKVLADVENGKASTGIGIYAGVLWALGMPARIGMLADPLTDRVGIALAARAERKNAGIIKSGIDNDF